MKNGFFIFFALIVFSSCSVCYECYDEINVGGTVTQTNAREVCSADGTEINTLEAQGKTCVPV